MINDNVVDDSNLAQCEYCGYVTDWDEVEYVNDPWSDGKVTLCPKCCEGESFNSYDPAKAVIRELASKAKEANGSGH